MNRVLLIGNVGREPEIKYYEADQCVASFTFATTERGYTLPNGTVVPDRTDWHNIVLFKALAKYAEKYIHKGDKLYIEGRIRYRSYDDKKGMRRYVTEIYGDNLEWLSTSRKNENISEVKVDDSADDTSDDTKLPF
ncbi:single-stranded DNA-binding protein [Prevotella scopos JCM 17725]|uniref:Single-stranded DNA-binding protein n=1 Tax=Prevotella scopos JCM 17725 TaxID=1236518 RepID=A0AAX2F7V6_9BACT|nr:single-stranded DNA-binding protein [Prevotella scopos]ANR72995.1 single-stranded DNA-binding protein [Prevotella scopos JCM 17725]QUB46110.1 single-stranded DNA-binding protein [Prevotella scopos JCM 17725]SHG20786.1 single-strand DNA-binding protein [Prevotella scopos JCM 17725]